jgi:hypothetical protein
MLAGADHQAQTSKEIIDTVRVFTRICSDEVIAGVLNRNGLLTGRGNRWTQERVTSLRSHHAIPCFDADKCEAEGWMNLSSTASGGNGTNDWVMLRPLVNGQ